MKIRGPDGNLYNFPDDAQDADITAFFEQQGPAEPTIKPSPLEAAKLSAIQRGTYEPTGPFGPPNLAEVQANPLIQLGEATRQGAGYALRTGAETATDLADAVLEQWGITPPEKGRGLIQGNYPLTAGGPAGWALRRFAPQIAEQIDAAAGKLVEAGTEPGTLALMPFGAAKPVQAFFTGSILQGIPESMQAAVEAPPGERLEKGLELGGSLALGGLLGRSLLRGPRTPLESEIQNATQERLRQEGRIPEYPGAEGERVSPEAGGSDRPQPAAGLEKEAQVLLDPAVQHNQSLGLGHEVEILDSLPNDPESRKVFASEPAQVDEQGNFVRPGKIRMSKAAFELWLKDTPPELRQQAFLSLFAEEGIHSLTRPADAVRYYESLTSAERALGKKLYLGGVDETALGLKADPGSAAYAQHWGYELLRQRMQQLMRMETSEAAEVAGLRKWGRRSLEILANIIRRARETFGTKAAELGSQVTMDMLDRASRNLDEALKGVREEKAPEPYEEGGPVEYEPGSEEGLGGEQPFGIRRVRGYDFDPDIRDKDVQVSVSKFVLPNGKESSYVQTDGIVDGQNVWSLNPELMREAGHDIPSSADILASVPAGRYRLDALRQMMPEGPQLPDQKPGTVRLYHGEGAAEGAGFGTSWFTKDWARAASYGDRVSYVDVPENVAREAQAKARQQGSGTGSDHLLPADLSKQAKPLPERLQPRVHDVGPAGIRRKATAGGEPEPPPGAIGVPMWEAFRRAEETDFGVQTLPGRPRGRYDERLMVNWFATTPESKWGLPPGVRDQIHAWFNEQRGTANDRLALITREIDNLRAQYGDSESFNTDDLRKREVEDYWEAEGEAPPEDYMQEVVGRVQEFRRAHQRISELQSLASKYIKSLNRPPAEYEPAGIRRGKGKPAPGEQDLPMGKIGYGKLSQPEKAPAAEVLAAHEAAALQPLTGNALSAFAKEHLNAEAAPDFNEFVKGARTRFGDLQPGQLRDAWQDAVSDFLMNAPGSTLRSVAKNLGMTKQLRLETPEGGLREISDPEKPLTETTELGMEVPLKETAAGRAAGTAPHEFTPKLRERYRVMGAIFEKLVAKAEGGRRFLARKEVQPTEVADPRTTTKQPVYNTITTADHADPENLGRILTDDARSPGGERITRVVGGKPVSVSKKGFPLSATKRLTAVQSLSSKKVWLVSTYRDSRRGPVLLDPYSPGGTLHVPLDQYLRRFRVVASVLLDEPVQNFKQEYANLPDYEESFGKPAREATARGKAYTAPVAEGQQPIHEPHRYQLDQPVTDAEARSIMDHLLDEVGKFEGPDDVKLALEGLRQKPNGQVISAYSKLANELQRKNPDLSTEDLLGKLAQQIYEDHKAAENYEDFQRRTMEKGPAGAGEAPGAPVPSQAQPTGARELSVPRFARKTPEGLPKGPGPEPKLPAPTPPEMMDPASKAWVESEIRRHEELEKARQEAKSGIVRHKYGGPEDPNSPAGLRRAKQRVEEATARVSAGIKAAYVRKDTERQLAATRDAAENIGNDEGSRAEAYVRGATQKGFAERSLPVRMVKSITGQTRPFGEKAILQAANAKLATGAIEPVYNWTPALRTALGVIMSRHRDFRTAQMLQHSTIPAEVATGFKMMREIRRQGIREMIRTGAMPAEAPSYNFNHAALNEIAGFKLRVQRGITQATALMNSGGPMARWRGRVWLKAAQGLMDELNYAEQHWGDPALVETATRMRRELDKRYDRERANGYQLRYDSNYLPGRYEAELFNDNSVVFGSRHWILGRLWRAPKTFDSYYHAIESGPYAAVTRDGAAIIGHRVRQGERTIQYKQWVESLKGYVDPDSGQTVAKDGVRRPDGSLASPGPDYVPMHLRPGHDAIFVRRGYERLVRNLTTSSAIQDWAGTRFALEWGQRLKHTLLLGDFFHLARLSYYSMSIMGTKAGYKGGLTALEYRPQDMAEAVRNGVIRQADMDWALGPVQVRLHGVTTTLRRVDLLTEFERNGLNVGRIQDALYKDLVKSVPLLGRYNKWLFDKYTRGLMAQAAIEEFERLHRAHPNVDAEALLRDVSRDTNNFFGSIGRQGWFKSASMQDLTRLVFLAPQWVEGLVMKEAGFGARLAGAPLHAAGLYRPNLPALGVMGRGIGRGLIVMVALTQAINLITRRKPTWMNEEKEHKFDAWIPSVGGKGEGFWLSPLAVFNELTHDLVRLYESKPNAIEAIVQIGHNKLSPWGRASLVFASGITPTGKYPISTAGRLKATAAVMAPLPISFSKVGQAAGHLVAPGVIPPAQRGSVQRQGLASFGFKVEPGMEPALQIEKLAQEFMRKEYGKEPTVKMLATLEPPSYPKLRNALRSEDWIGAKKMLDQISQTHSDKEIVKTMKTSARKPFTSKQHEREFVEGLTPAQAELYNRAIQQREEEYQKFLEWFSKQ